MSKKRRPMPKGWSGKPAVRSPRRGDPRRDPRGDHPRAARSDQHAARSHGHEHWANGPRSAAPHGGVPASATPGGEPSSEVVTPGRQWDRAYDQSALDRAREHWRRGDWAQLQELSGADIEHHPERARLALLAAAGHHAAGQHASTRLFTRMAAEWGCDRTLIARVLIGGVHNTLGRAAVASGRYRERALRHFDLAVSAGTPAAASVLATQSRIEHQLGQMGMSNELPQLRAASTLAGRVPVAGNPLKEIGEQLRKQTEALAASAKAQQDDLIKVRKHLETVTKKELLNATKQLEAFLNVQSALSGGDLIPGLHGWPISPDLAAYLIELIRANDYDLVIEFGSGTSTVVMAKALAQMSHRREGKAPVVQIAFEHLEVYHAQTQAQLRAAGLGDAATVHLAPLAPYRAANGKTYPYYTCQTALQALKADYDKPTCRALVLVDGPPASTGEHARYPAVSAVLAALPHVALDILLDDLIREDEQQVARMWQDDLKAVGCEAVAEVRKLEKDACLIRVQPQPAGT